MSAKRQSLLQSLSDQAIGIKSADLELNAGICLSSYLSLRHVVWLVRIRMRGFDIIALEANSKHTR